MRASRILNLLFFIEPQIIDPYHIRQLEVVIEVEVVIVRISLMTSRWHHGAREVTYWQKRKMFTERHDNLLTSMLSKYNDNETISFPFSFNSYLEQFQ